MTACALKPLPSIQPEIIRPGKYSSAVRKEVLYRRLRRLFSGSCFYNKISSSSGTACRYTREFFDKTLLGNKAPLYDDTTKLNYIDFIQRYGKATSNK